jgi:hypothetical protein
MRDIKKEIRRTQKTGVLVPMIMNFMTQNAVEIETQADMDFMNNLIALTAKREEMRRDGPRFFSPSSIGEPCVRKAYLARHAVKVPGAPSPYGLLPHFYFLTGNFLHLKWQFALHKMEQWIGNSTIFQVHAYELPVASKHGDHRGTIDVVASIYNEPYVIDFKGLNTFSAKKISYGKIPLNYRIQVADYLVLWNSQRLKVDVKVPRIEKGLLIVEDKTGGEQFLQEAVIRLSRDGKRARRKLQELREWEAKGQMPPPLCKSLKDKNFIGCQFRGICFDEVEARHKASTQQIREGLALVPPPSPQRISTVLTRRKKR